jgi:hypothetical protein
MHARPKLYRVLMEAKTGSIPRLDKDIRDEVQEHFRQGGLDGLRPFIRQEEVRDAINMVLDRHGLAVSIPEFEGKEGRSSVDLYWGMLEDESIGTLHVYWKHFGADHWVAKVRVS